MLIYILNISNFPSHSKSFLAIPAPRYQNPEIMPTYPLLFDNTENSVNFYNFMMPIQACRPIINRTSHIRDLSLVAFQLGNSY